MRTSKVALFATLTVVLFSSSSSSTSGDESDQKTEKTPRNGKLPLTSKAEFQQLLRVKRKEQLEAVKSLSKLTKNEHKLKMVNTLFEKIFDVQEEARSVLEDSAYVPGEEFDLPKQRKVLESLSSVIENCALLGDIILRLPSISKRVLYETNKWIVMTKWCISFTNATGLLDSTTSKLLNLVAQELDLIPREERYYNPFAEETDDDGKTKSRFASKQSKQSTTSDDRKSNDRRSKKKITKGPRLSKRIEL